ncbi:MAG: class I mannose-6-phosphate isomerase [Bacteroidota bacterium]
MERNNSKSGHYNIYPAFHLEDQTIFMGFDSLAKRIKKEPIVVIDGYQGVYFEEFRTRLDEALRLEGVKTKWANVEQALKPSKEIITMTAPFLGGDDPLFGTRTTLGLQDFYDQRRLTSIGISSDHPQNIIYGMGAALCGIKGLLLFIDLPKYELQQRSRKGMIRNIGHDKALNPKEMYKGFYFVDWVVLNRHKANIIKEIDIFLDGQLNIDVAWMEGHAARQALHTMSLNTFRVKPWFEPGVWGGSWIKENIPVLPQDVPNYAWSFELIVPENGLVLESSGQTLELSFDSLMFLEASAVLGEAYERFGSDFPIRFDFLDTFDGGNLSVQCHPRPEYIKTHFGEDFTQEECYYILDSKDNASVYLGFQDNIQPDIFESSLNDSFQEEKPIDIERFVQKHPAKKHDFFLIPYGTIHGSGRNNLVLEISSTPYIFTFKMYDWLRPDMDGKPRPLNIAKGMGNLHFDRKGSVVQEELISKPVLLDKGNDWSLFHLPTHPSHLYDVHRYHFTKEIQVFTNNKCHVLSLVEGQSVLVSTKLGMKQRYNYAETFEIPAAAVRYTVVNEREAEAIIVVAFVK